MTQTSEILCYSFAKIDFVEFIQRRDLSHYDIPSIFITPPFLEIVSDLLDNVTDYSRASDYANLLLRTEQAPLKSLTVNRVSTILAIIGYRSVLTSEDNRHIALPGRAARMDHIQHGKRSGKYSGMPSVERYYSSVRLTDQQEYITHWMLAFNLELEGFLEQKDLVELIRTSILQGPDKALTNISEIIEGAIDFPFLNSFLTSLLVGKLATNLNNGLLSVNFPHTNS